MSPINRKQKERIYKEKYKDIPLDYEDRLNYLIDKYNVSPKKMQEILDKRQEVLNNLVYYDYKVVILYEEPEGAARPRMRILKSNYNQAALLRPDLIHVYVPNAKDDNNYMHRLTQQELYSLDQLIYTPCNIQYDAYIATPSNTNIIDTFLCEIGLFRPPFKKPDWDNISKKYCDMYNANVWLDDTLVIDGSVHKWYSILPRVEIRLRYLNALYTRKDMMSLANRKGFNTNAIYHYLNNKGEITEYEKTSIHVQ